MALRVGNIISHTGGLGWGSGKVLEVTAKSAMIQFSDGTNRRIAVSHYTTLEPAAAGSFTPPPEAAATKVPRAPRSLKKKK
jgi:hypothetical protein